MRLASRGQARTNEGGTLEPFVAAPPQKLPTPCSLPPEQIVYLIIIADVLVGVPPDYNGLVTNLVGIHDPHGERRARRSRRSTVQHAEQPEPARVTAWERGSGAAHVHATRATHGGRGLQPSRLAPCHPTRAVWFVSRPFVLALACLLVLAPLLSLRDLGCAAGLPAKGAMCRL